MQMVGAGFGRRRPCRAMAVAHLVPAKGPKEQRGSTEHREEDQQIPQIHPCLRHMHDQAALAGCLSERLRMRRRLAAIRSTRAAMSIST